LAIRNRTAYEPDLTSPAQKLEHYFRTMDALKSMSVIACLRQVGICNQTSEK
jgi:hypothetical protein